MPRDLQALRPQTFKPSNLQTSDLRLYRLSTEGTFDFTDFTDFRLLPSFLFPPREFRADDSRGHADIQRLNPGNGPGRTWDGDAPGHIAEQPV